MLDRFKLYSLLPSLTIDLYTVCYRVFVDTVDSSHLQFVCQHKSLDLKRLLSTK